MSQLFRHGVDELKRLWERHGLKQRLAAHDAQRTQCVGRLGEHALQCTLTRPAHQALRDQIQQLTGRAGDLSAAATTLQQERDRLAERRRAEETTFNERRAVLQQKKAVIDQELSTLRAQVRKQESGADAQAASSTLAADIAARSTASNQLDGELDGLAREARAALHTMDEGISQVDAQLRIAATDVKDVERQRRTRCVELGMAIYTDGTTEQSLTPLVDAVAAEDARRADTQAAFDRSMTATRAMPPHAFRNFIAATLAIVLLVFAIPMGGYAAWRAWSGDAPKESDQSADGSGAAAATPYQPPINPYLDHELKDKLPYLLANRLLESKTEQDANMVLLELFRTIGVGIYTPQGQPVVRARDKNVYLYDFQVRILAHTVIVPSFMEFAEYSSALGQGISKFKEPIFLQVMFAPAILKRWATATANADDPANFLILVIDGLARRQPEPYSLDQFQSGGDHLPISPVQSVLMMLEFFIPNDAAPTRQAEAWPILRALEPTLLAEGPCDFLESDDGKKYWGYGVTAMSEAAEEAFGLELLNKGTALLREQITSLAVLFDRVTGLIEFLGDMITLYGIDVKVAALPPTIHLRHEYTDVDGVLTATVSFDPAAVPEDIVKCGWLVGKQMPPKGPMPDVEVSWRFVPALQPRLALHPKSDITSAGSEGLKSKTDKSGVSYFPLMASACPDKEGTIEGQDYLAIVSARVVTANIPTPTMISRGEPGDAGNIRPTLGATLPRVFLKFGPGMIEYFMGGRKGYDRFRAEWHKKKPRQYGS